MAQKTEAARVIAKLLASRHTSINEIPELIENVERALSSLDGSTVAARQAEHSEPTPGKNAGDETPTDETPAEAPRAKRSLAPRHARETHPTPAAAAAPEIKPAATMLVRRAEAVHAAPVAPPPPPAPTSGTLRGVVQWFDTRTNRGTLRLQGLSSDVPVDGETLSTSGLTRLFKGQEIEATLEGADDTPKIATLRLLNLAPNSPVMGGMVRDRHAKQVVVELKREALSRAAARAEAELLLPSRRVR